MTFETMVSFAEMDTTPITDFTDFYKKLHPKHMQILEDHKSEIAVIHGQGFKVKWTQKHDCDCPMCEIEEENMSKFFTDEKEAEDFVDELKDYPLDNWDIKKQADKYFIKAVKQKLNIGLFEEVS